MEKHYVPSKGMSPQNFYESFRWEFKRATRDVRDDPSTNVDPFGDTFPGSVAAFEKFKRKTGLKLGPFFPMNSDDRQEINGEYQHSKDSSFTIQPYASIQRYTPKKTYLTGSVVIQARYSREIEGLKKLIEKVVNKKLKVFEGELP